MSLKIKYIFIMLNIFTKKYRDNLSNNTLFLDKAIKKDSSAYGKHFPAATKEWYDSIYTYNKNSTKALTISNNIVMKITKSYFDFYNLGENTETKKVKRLNRLQLKLRRLSTNKIIVSKAEMKHTNSKTIITIYVYNAQEKYLLNKIRKCDPTLRITNKEFIEKVNLIRNEAIKITEQYIKEKTLLATDLTTISNKYKTDDLLINKNFIIKSLKKEILSMCYLRLLNINKLKFQNTYLLPLNVLLNKIYGKKVEFNIVNLRYIQLNSDIFSESIATKIKNRKNTLLRVLKTSLSLIRLPNLNKFYDKYGINYVGINSNINKNLKYFSNTEFNKNEDIVSTLIQKILVNSSNKSITLENKILNSVRHKPISGLRIEVSGRLSRRLTAARSVFKFKYKGSLKDIDSSYNSLSSTILRGHVKPNIQYTKISSKTRNGSFGIKGWISSE